MRRKSVFIVGKWQLKENSIKLAKWVEGAKVYAMQTTELSVLCADKGDSTILIWY